MHLKYHSINSGFCRVYFKNGRDLYCIQGDHGMYDFLTCTRSGEPECSVAITDETFDLISEKDVISSFEEEVNEFLHGINIS